MTRLQAIRILRKDQPLQVRYHPHPDDTSDFFEVGVRYGEHCNLNRSKREAHQRIGPIHMTFLSGQLWHTIHITPQQLLGWIKRNYRR